MKYIVNLKMLAWMAGFLLAGLSGSLLYGQGGIGLDFSTDPEARGVQFTGNAVWRDKGGVDNSGYLSVTDALNGQRGVIIFPDLSNPKGTALSSFQITADLRVGGGTASPADGFSFNLVRPDDPIIEDPDSPVFAASPANEANLPEEGSTTGLAIGFDEWQSGPRDSSVPATECGSVQFDCIGLSIRVDNALLAQAPFPTLNGALSDQTSLQTGPQGKLSGLGWARLLIQLKPDAANADNSKLLVAYKDRIVFDQSIPYKPTPGQLVFAGRTGDANSNHHIDNISIVTDFANVTLGDFNNDKKIDLTDFGILKSNMNTGDQDTVFADGDMDFNRQVDLVDFAEFRRVYLAANPGAPPLSVPEPSALAMLGVGILGFYRFHRGRFRNKTRPV